MIYMISYDLKTPGKNYDDLYQVLKAAPSWWHYLESTWIIQTTEGIGIWNEKIRNVIDHNDNVIIVDITRQSRDGWLPTKAWDWIREHEN